MYFEKLSRKFVAKVSVEYTITGSYTREIKISYYFQILGKYIYYYAVYCPSLGSDIYTQTRAMKEHAKLQGKRHYDVTIEYILHTLDDYQTNN